MEWAKYRGWRNDEERQYLDIICPLCFRQRGEPCTKNARSDVVIWPHSERRSAWRRRRER